MYTKTMGPNSYTGPDAIVPSEFEWTAPGLGYFLENLKRDYPHATIVQNRGLFFFDPRLSHYAHSPRGLIDFVMFESYRLDSNTEALWQESFYFENQKRIRQSLMVEASQPNGFQVLSLGYEEGPGAGNEVGKDIQEALASGFIPYITNAAITEIDTRAKEISGLPDTQAPEWSSTGYVNTQSWPHVYQEALIPRVGITDWDWGSKSGYLSTGFRIYYDIALDQNPVNYMLYRMDLREASNIPADNIIQSSTPWLIWEQWPQNGQEWQEFFSRSELIPLETQIRPEYSNQYVTGFPNYSVNNEPPVAYWSEIPEMEPGVTYLFLLRARDSLGNETTNRNVARINF